MHIESGHLPAGRLITLSAFLALSVSLSRSQGDAVCLGCHGDTGATMSRKGKTVSLFVDAGSFRRSAHGQLECVACHEGFNPSELPHARRIRPVNCASCHTDQQFENYKVSAHGRVAGGVQPAACADCHGTHAIVKVSAETPEARKRFAVETCAKCHGSEKQKFLASDHAAALSAGIQSAPSCVDCHGEHEVKGIADETARTSRRNLSAMCLGCHADKQEVREIVGVSVAFFASFENSIHARAMKAGNDAAATCIDCHGSHDVKRGSRPDSKVARANIAETCGGCHADVLEQYTGSIHGTSFAKGVTAAATCTDCHGEHNILSPSDAASRVSARNVSSQVCSPCHASVMLVQKYGMAADRSQSYADSYHGLAGKAGDLRVANCASCHGVHDIKPSSDSTSRIAPKNLVKTCGTCHPGANTNFTRGAVHLTAAAANSRILNVVSTSYIVLIIVVIGGMVLHNVFDFLRKSRRRLMERRGALHRHRPGHRLYLRMSLSERLQHGTLLLSFLILVLTGFALKFPDAWWVAPVRDISPLVFSARGVLHRIAGVVMILASLYHLYYIVFVPRGKQLLRDLLPVPGDIRDAMAVLKYNLGVSREKPAFGRFSYIEKSEYWALVWGTIIMGATGLILWFDNTFLGLLTKTWWDVAGMVHYYEAWLATLAIIVWHFYFVIFNPDTYPINLAFWKGTLTEEEMEDEHPGELEEIRRKSARNEAAGT